jgi:hypothetical protein
MSNIYTIIRHMEREAKRRAFYRRISTLANTGRVTVVCRSQERAQEITRQVKVLEARP